jgi:hypothetical protein
MFTGEKQKLSHLSIPMDSWRASSFNTDDSDSKVHAVKAFPKDFV